MIILLRINATSVSAIGTVHVVMVSRMAVRAPRRRSAAGAGERQRRWGNVAHACSADAVKAQSSGLPELSMPRAMSKSFKNHLKGRLADAKRRLAQHTARPPGYTAGQAMRSTSLAGTLKRPRQLMGNGSELQQHIAIKHFGIVVIATMMMTRTRMTRPIMRSSRTSTIT